jgi:Rhodanese-related sulfurtransferase
MDGHIPGASFLDVDAELSDLSVSGCRPPPTAVRREVRGRGRSGGHRLRRLRGGVRLDGRRGAAVVAAPPLRPRRLRRPARRHRGMGRRAPRRRRGDRACRVRPAGAGRRHDRGGGDRPPPRRPGACARRRADAEPLAGEPNEIDDPPGRIPGAANAPWNEPLPELPRGELVAYCGSGVSSCVTLHRAWLAGREGRLYPGSWSEWSKRGLPLERS